MNLCKVWERFGFDILLSVCAQLIELSHFAFALRSNGRSRQKCHKSRIQQATGMLAAQKSKTSQIHSKEGNNRRKIFFVIPPLQWESINTVHVSARLTVFHHLVQNQCATWVIGPRAPPWGESRSSSITISPGNSCDFWSYPLIYLVLRWFAVLTVRFG